MLLAGNNSKENSLLQVRISVIDHHKKDMLWKQKSLKS